MGSCTRRHFLLSTCFLQMITIIERQVFDFLGYMWAPIFVNFFQILFIIFGFYGAYHFRVKYIITYLLWSFLWIGWNAFLICFYLDVGKLDKDSDLLNLGTGSVSWFEINGYGCKPTYPTNITSDDPFRPIRPERVDDCLLEYPMIEVIHSGVQCALAFFGIIGAIFISYIFLDEDDRFDFMNGDAKSPQHTVVHPMYVSYTSIPTSASATMLSNKHHHNNYHNHAHHNNHHHHHQLHHQQQQQQQTYNNNNNNINNHHQQQQQHAYNNNTFVIHSNSNTPNASKNNTLNSSKNSSSRNKIYSPKNNKISATTMLPIAAATAAAAIIATPTTTKTTTTTTTTTTATATPKAKLKSQKQQKYYDDSTAKADHQLYTNNSNNNNNQRQHMLPVTLSPTTSSPSTTTSSNTPYHQQQQQQRQQLQHVVAYPNHNNNNNYNNTNNTNSSLSYASLQKYSAQDSVEFLSSNSNSNLNMAVSLRGSAAGVVGLAGIGALSSSNYSISSSNNNNNNNNSSGSGRFARIHAKPKPPKSLSYSSFINGGSSNGVAPSPPLPPGIAPQQHRPDIRYTHISSEQLARAQAHAQAQAQAQGFGNFEESFEDDLDDDIISLQNFKGGALTYVPFQKPVPGNLYLSGNNNPSYASLNSNYSGNNNTSNANGNQNNHNNITSHSKVSPNNNQHQHNNNSSSLGLGLGAHPLTRDNSQLFLSNNNDLLLERHDPPSLRHQQPAPTFLSPANRMLFQQNGLPFQPQQQHSNPRPPRPSNIPLPTVPHPQYTHPQYTPQSPISPSAVTPPPPPAPRPHIFAPRSGHAPYPDLSPEVTERYAMPTQYVPRSPVASRIVRRQRQQAQHERSHLANMSANFCDQIRDAPPGYIDTGFNIVRAKSQERLTTTSSLVGRPEQRGAAAATPKLNTKDAAPQVNRRSGRSGGKTRPRSYCNSFSSTGGEGVIRGGAVINGRGGLGGIGGIDVAYS